MKVIKNKEKGITLIALIVTIIVLLLLAGVGILALTGENSILRRAHNSARDTEREAIKEELQVDIMGKYGEEEFDIEKYKEEIEKKYGVTVKEGDYDENGFRVEVEGEHGTYTLVVEKDPETGKASVDVIDTETDEEGNVSRKKPGDLTSSNTQIKFEPSGWTNKGVKVTIKLSKSVDKGASTLQYSIEGTDEWNTYRRPFEITENNTVIVARLWNGEEEGATTTATIKYIDKLQPEILSVGEVAGQTTTSTVTLEVNAKDAEETPTDGESKIGKYYFMNEENGKWVPEKGSDNPQYKIGGLKQNTEYTFKIKVVDNAGNEAEYAEEIKVRTKGLQDLGPDGTSNTKIEINPNDWVPDKVTVSIKTDAEIGEGARLQYSINEGATWNDYNDTPFEVTENETVIIARLYDGTNESGYATGTVTKIDKIKPYDVEMKVTGDKKTSKIQVQVSAKDDLSGIAKYIFYYKIDGGNDYVKAGEKTVTPEKISSTTYTYENLPDGKNYTLRVEAYDKVDNKNEERAEQGGKEVTTTGETKEMPTVNNNNLKISFSPTTWAKSTQVIITPNGLNIDEDSHIEYQVEGEDWKPYYDNSRPSVAKNTAVNARVTDGTNTRGYATGTITRIDTVPPSTVTISKSTNNSNSITVNYSGTDGSSTTTSGKSGIKKFRFYYSTNGGSSYTYKDEYVLSTSNTGTYSSTFTYSGLSSSYSYKLKVEAYDEAENMKSAETGTIQLASPPLVSLYVSKVSNSTSSLNLSITLNDADGGSLNYKIEYGTSSSYGRTYESSSRTASSSSFSKTVSGLSSNTTYYFKVTATDGTGLSNYDTDYDRTYCYGYYCSGTYSTTSQCYKCGGTGQGSGVCNGVQELRTGTRSTIQICRVLELPTCELW